MISVLWNHYIRRNASNADFIPIKTTMLNNKTSEEWLIAVYYPKDYPTAKLDDMEKKFKKDKKIVETNSDLFTKIELPDVDQK